jgi:type II secretory ATPase GspE/PulE/Tfp pilus assembly ATPase PilB-like protein
MSVSVLPIVPARAPGVFTWPVPPFFRRTGAPSPGHARDCKVELLNGRTIEGQLLSFESGFESIDLALAEGGCRQVSIDQVRMIVLTASLSLISDADRGGPGDDETPVVEERSFSARFRDGSTFAGTTRGFIKENAGLFLYLLEGGESHKALRCFIPAQQLADAQFGPLLGENRAIQKEVNSKDLAAALNKQARLHQERLGKQLADRGVVSPDELKQALHVHRGRPTMKLGELLVEASLVSPKQLDDALRVQAENRQRRLGDILVDMGLITPSQVQMALSEKLGIPFVNLREFKIDPTVLELVSAAFANRHQVLPLLRMGESLVVAMEDPLAVPFTQQLDFLTNHATIPVIANPDELRERIAKEYANLELPGIASSNVAKAATPVDSVGARDLSRMQVEELATELGRTVPQLDEPGNAESDARVTDNALVRLVNKIILEAHSQGASDIHVESYPGKANTRIRFRKDGDLEDYIELQPAYRSALISRIKVMAGLDISEHRRGQDGKIAFSKFGPLSIELRVAVVPTADNLEDVVLRILGGVEPLPLEKLGLCGRDMSELKKMVAHSYGLILVCGPTGSGKTTTLHSALQAINRPDVKIWTAEDPVEITQPGLRQVQVNPRIDWTFAAAMRAFLRADPDIIMVGEMRDAETTKIGIEASLTGHLVFSTLHTNSASESVVRLLELGMDPFNFSDALVGILSQRLARTLCKTCKKPHVATDAEITDLAREFCIDTTLDTGAVIAQWRQNYGDNGQLQLQQAVGCDTCGGTGYKGRVGVYELLVATPRIKDVIRARGSAPQILEAALNGGMRLLRQDAIEKVLSGQLDLMNARAVST